MLKIISETEYSERVRDTKDIVEDDTFESREFSIITWWRDGKIIGEARYYADSDTVYLWED